MLMDGDKIDRNLPYTFSTETGLYAVITDRELPPVINRRFTEAGVRIIIAE